VDKGWKKRNVGGKFISLKKRWAKLNIKRKEEVANGRNPPVCPEWGIQENRFIEPE